MRADKVFGRVDFLRRGLNPTAMRARLESNRGAGDYIRASNVAISPQPGRFNAGLEGAGCYASGWTLFEVRVLNALLQELEQRQALRNAWIADLLPGLRESEVSLQGDSLAR